MNGKKASLPSNHSPPFKPYLLSLLYTPKHEASARLRATSTRLLHFHSFILEWTFPFPGPQISYLSLSTFKACPNASCSMKLALNPHLALVLSVVPTGLCLHFHYRIEPSGLQILTCCLPSPQDYQLLEDRDSVTHLRVPNA